MHPPPSTPGVGRVLRAGLAAGLLMNVLGWLGNQLVLGSLWKSAIVAAAPRRSRTWVHELVSLVPDFIYGIAVAALFVALARHSGTGLRTALVAALAIWGVGVVPAYLGIANSGLLPAELCVATTLVGLVASLPTAWLVQRLLREAPESR